MFSLNQVNRSEIHFPEFSNYHNHAEFGGWFLFYTTILTYTFYRIIFTQKKPLKHFTILLTEV